MKAPKCRIDLYLQNATKIKEIGWELTVRCEDLYFGTMNMLVTKFKVSFASSQTWPLRGEFLISQQPSNRIWEGFLYSKGVVCPHILRSCLWDLNNISPRNSWNTACQTKRFVLPKYGNSDAATLASTYCWFVATRSVVPKESSPWLASLTSLQGSDFWYKGDWLYPHT